MSKPEKGGERAWISGERFEAYVSPDRSMVDIVDRETGKRLILLSEGAVQELRGMCDELDSFMKRG